jgi:hypothetical protein
LIAEDVLTEEDFLSTPLRRLAVNRTYVEAVARAAEELVDVMCASMGIDCVLGARLPPPGERG